MAVQEGTSNVATRAQVKNMALAREAPFMAVLSSSGQPYTVRITNQSGTICRTPNGESLNVYWGSVLGQCTGEQAKDAREAIFSHHLAKHVCRVQLTSVMEAIDPSRQLLKAERVPSPA